MQGIIVLSTSLRTTVDRAWDAVWSNGITNPITVSDLLATVLMATAQTNGEQWNELHAVTECRDPHGIARAIAAVRRDHGLAPGSEFETAAFWDGNRALESALRELEYVHEQAVGTDVLGDIYEHVLSKLSLAGQFGQFRTPRHIVNFMVDLIEPRNGETVVDPACGSGGFLVAASDFRKKEGTSGQYLGSEIDRTVARIAEANLTFHAVSDGTIENRDGLVPVEPDADVILANPPFAGSVSEAVAATYAVRTLKTELLFLEAMMHRLKFGGRAAVIVPSNVLTSTGKAYRAVRQMLLERNRLRAVIELPSGVFRPYSDVKTAILVWDAASPGETVEMLRIEHDGFSLDQRRVLVKQDDLPEALKVLQGHEGAVQHARIPVTDLVAANYNLNPARFIENAEPTATAGPVDRMEDVLTNMTTRMTRIQDAITRMHEEATR